MNTQSEYHHWRRAGKRRKFVRRLDYLLKLLFLVSWFGMAYAYFYSLGGSL